MNLLNINQKISHQSTNSKALISPQSAQSKMKPIHGKSVTFQYLMPSNLANITKYRPKMLSTVELANIESNKPNFKTIRTICRALKDFKKASSLKIRYNGSNSQNLKQLKHLLNNPHHHWKKLAVSYKIYEERKRLDENTVGILTRLRGYRSLSSLEVNFYCFEDTKMRLLPHLLQQIKGLKNLKIFRLDTSYCEFIEEEDYEPNAPIFKFKFPRSLESISISFQKSSLRDSKLLNLFASNLSRCNFLTFLNLNCDKMSSAHKSSILSSLFEKKQCVKDFRIKKKFSELEQIPESQIFIQDFTYMKDLIIFSLQITFDFPESKIFTKNLFQNLASLQNLKVLKIDLHVQKYSSDNFLLHLQSLKHLKKLILILHGHAGQETTHLQSLPQAFQSLSELTSLKLFFYDHKISHTDIISLSHIFKSLALLHTLVLVLSDTDLEYDSLDILYERIAHLNLSFFVFRIEQQTPNSPQHKKTSLWKDDKGLASLFSTLYDFNSLSTLDLNLSTFDIPTKELKNLSLALRGMKQLTSLYLQLSRFDPDRRFQGLRSLLSSLKEIPKLVSFEFSCQGEELCDEEVELIASNLAESKKYLQTLELNFCKAKDLGNRSLLAMKNGLQNLLTLNNLTLVFGPKNTFSQKTVLELLETLSFLKNLDTIKVEFPSEVVPWNFANLLRKMGGHWNLKTFTVNQKSCLRKH